MQSWHCGRWMPDSRRFDCWRCLVVGLVGLLMSVSSAWAWAWDTAKLEGDWLAPAEDADDVDAIITLTRQAGLWSGHIKTILVTRADQKWRDGSLCVNCAVPKQGQPWKGLEVIWGLREVEGVLASGSILDPSDGRVYDCEIRLSADAKTLRVVAYKGLKLLGHEMTWRRP